MLDKIYVVYWSQSGNTAAMADAVGQGITEAGKEAEVIEVSSASLDALKEEKAFALGCPAMGAEVLEESEMEPFVAEVESFAAGKTIALFGSYGWGDGEWMQNWEETCKNDGASLACDSVICNETPDDEAEANCVNLGKALA